MLSVFIDLVTGQTLSSEERDAIIARLTKAPHNPNYQWTSGPAQAMAVELLFALDDYLIVGTSIETIHQQLQDMFDSDFPALPAILPESMEAYFSWLDLELTRCGDEDGGYELIRFEPNIDENTYLMLVDRRDTEEILRRAEELGFQMSKCQTA